MKTPSAKQLPSGSWRCRVTIDGKTHSIVRATKAEAEKDGAAIKIGVMLPDGKKKSDTSTLSGAIDRYITARSNTLSPSTIRGYRTIQKNRFQDAMQRQVADISKVEWQSICNREANLCSAKTLVNSWRFISSVIYEETENRFDIRLPQIVSNEREFLDPEQIEIFVKAITNTAIEIPALLALSSLRRSEILALKWKNIDLDKGIIKVDGSAVYDENQQMVYKKENKNSSSRRIVPIMMEQLKTALATEEKNSQFVVTMHHKAILNAINKCCEDNGLPKVGIHGLRHSFASLAYHLQIPEKIAMEIGGWSNDQTMRKIYTHVAKSDLDRYKTAMCQYFDNIKK